MSGQLRRNALITVVLGLAFTATAVSSASPAATWRIAATPMCRGIPATIVGTHHNDILRGTGHVDVIVAGKRIDTVHARGGNDLICGGRGGDRLYGGGGRDRIFGQSR